MDKRIIFAVAGSGKTSLIIENLNIEQRSLLITYTESNLVNLRRKIIEKFGYFPENITLYSYFTFLYSFCYKPFLAMQVRAKGINWNVPHFSTLRIKRNNIAFYMDRNKLLYHNRIAKLLEVAETLDEVNQRIEKYFDCFYVDEVQDFAGNDFNLLASLSKSNVIIKYVGDYFQHTFDTSRDGVTNKSLHDDYKKYQARFTKMGMQVDFDTLSSSYRCSPTVCEFITKSIGIDISSHRNDNKSVELVEDSNRIDELFKCSNTVKLFYQNHQKYQCYSNNWGASKGEDHYDDVCVVLNKNSFKQYQLGKLNDLVPQTKNKLYVACSRTRNNLYFISEESIKKYKQ